MFSLQPPQHIDDAPLVFAPNRPLIPEPNDFSAGGGGRRRHGVPIGDAPGAAGGGEIRVQTRPGPGRGGFQDEKKRSRDESRHREKGRTDEISVLSLLYSYLR